MTQLTFPMRALALSALLALGTSGSMAEKPPHAGGGKPHEQEQRQDAPRHTDDGRAGVSVQIHIGSYFTVSQRQAVVEYYEPRFKAGKCPPGLARKNNGCQPPGLAKQWHKGQPLPRDVVHYPVPEGVSLRLGLPPEGHKFVRVATDILLIAVGTGMVVDAIEDLSRL